MKFELTPDAEQWVRAEVAAGTFPTAEDAVRYAIKQGKLMAFRSKLDAAVTEGGEHTAEDYVRDHLDRLDQMPRSS